MKTLALLTVVIVTAILVQEAQGHWGWLKKRRPSKPKCRHVNCGRQCHYGYSVTRDSRGCTGCRCKPRPYVPPKPVTGVRPWGYTCKNRQYLDSWTNAMYIPNFRQKLRAGIVSYWKIYARRTGRIILQIWRRRGSITSYMLVGQSTFTIRHTGVVTLRPPNQIRVLNGDVIGFFFPGHSIIPFSGRKCHNERGLYVQRPSFASLRPGRVFRFRNMLMGWNPCRHYSLQVYIGAGVICPKPAYACLRRAGCTYKDARGCVHCKPECGVNVRPVIVQPIDLVFVVDAAGSIGNANFRQLLTFLVGFVKQVRVTSTYVRIAIISYSTNVKVECRLNQYTHINDVIKAIYRIRLAGRGTYTNLALLKLLTIFSVKEGGRPNVPKVAILFTGGRSHSSSLTIQAATRVRAAGIITYAVGITKTINRHELLRIVTSSSYFYYVQSYTLLYTISIRIVHTIYIEIGTNPCKPNPCRFNARCVSSSQGGATCVCAAAGHAYTWQHGCKAQCPQIRCATDSCPRGFLKNARGCPTCNCVPGPTVPPITACKEKQTDLVFVVDSSGSIGKKNFVKLKSFLVSMVRALDVGPRGMQVGMMSFSKRVRVEFGLNKYTEKNDVIKAIQRVRYMSQLTYTHLALRKLPAMFSSQQEVDVSHVAIVITDGRSQSYAKTVAAARAARKAGITIYALGITTGINKRELNEIATDPDSSHVFTVHNFSDLKKITQALGKKICTEGGADGSEMVYVDEGGKIVEGELADGSR